MSWATIGGGLGVGDQDEAALAAVLPVELQHRLGGGAGTAKEVQHQVARLGGDAQDALDEADRLGGVEGRLGAENVLDLLAGLVGIADFLVGPPSPWNESICLAQVILSSRYTPTIHAEEDAAIIMELVEFVLHQRPTTTFRRRVLCPARSNNLVHLVRSISLCGQRHRLPGAEGIIVRVLVQRPLLVSQGNAPPRLLESLWIEGVDHQVLMSVADCLPVFP